MTEGAGAAAADQSGDRIRIDPLSHASTDDLVELARLSLGQGRIPRTAEFWDWKHRRNPFGESLGRVASAPTGLAAMRAFMRWNWTTGNRTVAAVRAVDTATHPDFRRRGLFRRLTERALQDCADAGIEFVFNTPNDKSLPGYLKMGWRRVGRLNLRVRPYRPLRGLRRALATWRTGSSPAAREWRPTSAARDVLEGPGACRAVPATPARDSRFSTVKSLDYLQWRYAEAPGLAYGALRSDTVEGCLLIYQVRCRAGLVELTVCELLSGAKPEQLSEAARLVRRAAEEHDVDYAVALAAAATPESRALRRAGFVPAPRVGPVLTVRPIGSSPPGLHRLAAWRPSVGDLELF